MKERKLLYKDKFIEELSREKLLEVVKMLYESLEELRDAHTKTLKAWQLFRKAR